MAKKATKRMGRPPKGPKPVAICLKVNPDTDFRFRRYAGKTALCDALTQLVDLAEGKTSESAHG